MKIEYFKEYSHNLGKDMEFKVFGHAGKPCIFFPTQNGRFFDYEDRGLIYTIRDYIEDGRIQVFCVDSVDIDSWSSNKPARWALETHEAYYRYIIEELVPRIYDINTYGNGGGVASGVMVYGCSMGAFHAMNFFLRRPDVFDAILAISGIYHSSFFIKNYADDLTFLNSAVDQLKHMSPDHHYIDLYKKSRIIVCVGGGAYEEEFISEAKQLEAEMKKLGIDAFFDYWGFDYTHDWPSWHLETLKLLDYILD